jgi:transcriptional regulator with XRE-family HTH domain
MSTYKSRFGEMLREARENAAQTPDVMAILLNIPPDDYAEMEAGIRFPDDEALRRLCMMMEWNYMETSRLIRNETSSTSRAVALNPVPPRESSIGPMQGHPLNPDGTPGVSKVESLGERLKEVRLLTGQSSDIIGALLNIGTAGYQRLEEGEMPSDELLRRISMIYNWNYYDLQAILRSEQAQQLSPRRVGNPFPNTGVKTDRLRTVCREIEAVFAAAPEAEQEMMLAQLELIRSTLQRHRRTELPAGSQLPAPSGAVPNAPVAPTTHRRKSSMTPSLPGISDRKIFPA